MSEPRPFTRPAARQLVDLAAACRPDWQAHAVETALAEAASVGWSWPVALVRMARLIADPDAVPGDLVTYDRAGRAAPPERQAEHAARIRAELYGQGVNGGAQRGGGDASGTND